MYQRVCNYFAYLYRYDWYVSPEIRDEAINTSKVLKDFYKIIDFLDHTNIKKICGDVALEVIRSGAYYGYIVTTSSGLALQQLPIQYCRSRFSIKGLPVVEFDMRFFDTFSNSVYKEKILNLFPKEFKKGYSLYKLGKLPKDSISDEFGSWYLLDTESTVKFSFSNGDLPLFVNAIPAMLDLDAAQDLDRKKQMQKLLKIIVQKLPRDKNGDLIFDGDEAKDIHNSAVKMLSRAVGVDVLTTFADIESVDMSDRNTSTTKDDLEKVERSVFNALGISQNLFNTDGNLSLEKSILNDESSVRTLLLQFSMFFDRVVNVLVENRKYNFKFYMLETTQYNYKELSKIYKEQVQLGYSKLLPQIALGQSQSFILNSIKFENDMLELSSIMVPPLMSSTLNGEDLLKNKGESNLESTNKNQTSSETKTSSSVGRPSKDESELAEKTIQNRESMS